MSGDSLMRLASSFGGGGEEETEEETSSDDVMRGLMRRFISAVKEGDAAVATDAFRKCCKAAMDEPEEEDEEMG